MNTTAAGVARRRRVRIWRLGVLGRRILVSVVLGVVLGVALLVLAVLAGPVAYEMGLL